MSEPGEGEAVAAVGEAVREARALVGLAVECLRRAEDAGDAGSAPARAALEGEAERLERLGRVPLLWGPWVDLELLPGWRAVDGFCPPQARRRSDGLVHSRGAARPERAGVRQPMFRLPEDMQPSPEEARRLGLWAMYGEGAAAVLGVHAVPEPVGVGARLDRLDRLEERRRHLLDIRAVAVREVEELDRALAVVEAEHRDLLAKLA